MPSKKQTIKMYLAPEEYQDISAKAAQAKLSLSTYAKKLCLGYNVHSTVDAEAVLRLIQLKAEVGRIGGLLKKALADNSLHRTPLITKQINDLENIKQEIIQRISELGA